MGLFFVCGQGCYEYIHLSAHGTTIPGSAYGTVFYLATGFHGLHVIGGLIAFVLLLARTKDEQVHARRPPPRSWCRTTGTSSTSCGLRCSRHLLHPLIEKVRCPWTGVLGKISRQVLNQRSVAHVGCRRLSTGLG